MPFNNPQQTGSSLAIKDEGITVATAAQSIDFAGAGVTASAVGQDATASIPGGGASANFATNEVVSGSGTAFTLGHTPVLGTQSIFALGQKLTPTTDYSISGAVITTVNSWLAGQILADYQY